MRKFSSIFLIISIILIVTGVTLQYFEVERYKEALECLTKLYQDEKKSIPLENITQNDIKKVEDKIKKVSKQSSKKDLQKQIDELKSYLELKQNIDTIFSEDILKYDVTAEEINGILRKYESLPKLYKKQLTTKIENLNKQLSDITKVNVAITNLFQNYNNLVIRDDLTRIELNSVIELLNSLPQKDNMQKEYEYLNTAGEQLTKKEEEKRQQEINNAWVILEVPYISQNHNNVYNGCEAAALLMGLQYKGYLPNMDIISYANNMPKTDNPNTGFYRSIFDVEPSDLPHWIAPAPLAEYGRTTSGNGNVVDISGSSFEQLDIELSNNNPVVIYATAMFQQPKNWIEEVPNNLHVMLLTGYNKITKEQIITDPWTYSTGRTKWQISKEKLEALYNQIGKRAVAIR